MRLLALGLVGDLELAIGDAGLGLELLGAVEGMLSLKDLSNLPPMSKTMAGLSSAAKAAVADMATAATAASRLRLFIAVSLIVSAGYNHIAIRVAIPFFIVGSRPAGRRRPAA